jgi:hypothetical protein
MSPTITVSTDVYADIWARRKEGQESEEAILRDVLVCPKAQDGAKAATTGNGTGGVCDLRNDARFSRGIRSTTFGVKAGKKN